MKKWLEYPNKSGWWIFYGIFSKQETHEVFRVNEFTGTAVNGGISARIEEFDGLWSKIKLRLPPKESEE